MDFVILAFMAGALAVAANKLKGRPTLTWFLIALATQAAIWISLIWLKGGGTDIVGMLNSGIEERTGMALTTATVSGILLFGIIMTLPSLLANEEAEKSTGHEGESGGDQPTAALGISFRPVFFIGLMVMAALVLYVANQQGKLGDRAEDNLDARIAETGFSLSQAFCMRGISGWHSDRIGFTVTALRGNHMSHEFIVTTEYHYREGNDLSETRTLKSGVAICRSPDNQSLPTSVTIDEGTARSLDADQLDCFNRGERC